MKKTDHIESGILKRSDFYSNQQMGRITPDILWRQKHLRGVFALALLLKTRVERDELERNELEREGKWKN
jgi:hypothetical protein